MEKVYKICLFDLDGTITDSAPGIVNSVIYALKKFGIEETDREKLLQFIGPPLTESFHRFYGFTEEESWNAVEYYREYYAEKGIFECTVYEGLEDALKKIKESGRKILVATSKPEVYAKRIIEHFGLTKYFDYIAGMELDGGRGTKAQVIEYALETCKIKNRDEVLMIGDREHDVFGAESLGIDCVGVLYGFGSREELERAGAKYVISRPEDLINILESNEK